VVGITVAFAVWSVAREAPLYRAQAAFLVVPSARVVGSSSDATVSAIGTLRRSAVLNTLAEMATSSSVVRRAAASLGYSDAEVSGLRTRSSVVPGTFTVQVSVEGDDPSRAAGLATAVVQETGSLGSQLYPALEIRVLEQAAPPSSPVRPQPLRDVGLAALGGLLLGLIAAYLVGRVAESAAPEAPRAGG
jgi:uncharacterized protein involved in exopolysaccharide biosynthesis